MTTETATPLINLEDIYRRFDTSDTILRDIRDLLAQTYRRRTIVRISSNGASTATDYYRRQTRFFVEYIVISADVGQTYSIVVGTESFPVYVANSPARVDLPLLLDRGVDVRMICANSATMNLYLIGTVE